MEATMAQTATLKVGDKAPDFSLVDHANNKVTLYTRKPDLSFDSRDLTFGRRRQCAI